MRGRVGWNHPLTPLSRLSWQGHRVNRWRTQICSPLWWSHQMETFSAILAFCAGNSPVTAQRPVTLSFDVFFDLRLNQQLSNQWGRRWIETPSHSLWRHCNVVRFTWQRITSNRACHPGCHLWGYYPGSLSLNQVTVTYLKTGHP